MLGVKKKEKNIEKEKNLSLPIKSENKDLIISEKSETGIEIQKDCNLTTEKAKNEPVNSNIYEKFPDLARLMNTTVEQLRDEFFLFQIRKLMSRIGKVLVRYNVSEQELERIFLNANALTLNQVMVSPVYLPVCERIVKRHKLHNVCVGSVVDFPFGESSFKSKLHNVRDSVRIGVDEVSVMIPSLHTTTEYLKTYKKEVKKVGKAYKKRSGIVLNATDLDEEQIKRAIKIAGKSKLKFLVFAFGEATLEELKSKMQIVNKFKSNKKICVLANVDRAESIMELFKLNVDRILTPYADEIGEELVKRFDIKSVKLH